MNDAAITRNEQGSRTDAPARDESAQRSDTALIPPVDVIEDSTRITLRADLPGAPKGQAEPARGGGHADDRGRGRPRSAGGHGGELCRSRCAAIPTRVHAVQGTRYRQGIRGVQARRADSAHSQGRARTATQDSDQCGPIGFRRVAPVRGTPGPGRKRRGASEMSGRPNRH